MTNKEMKKNLFNKVLATLLSTEYIGLPKEEIEATAEEALNKFKKFYEKSRI